MISSPAYCEFNWFSKLQDIKYPNKDEYICFTVKAELSCEACKKRGVAAYCTHHNSMIPPWISDNNKFVSGLIYKALKMEKAGERELSGISDSNAGMAINMQLIDRFSKKEFFVGESYNKPRFIGIFVDPNAGGTSSMAIVSVTIIAGAFVVCLFIVFLSQDPFEQYAWSSIGTILKTHQAGFWIQSPRQNTAHSEFHPTNP